MRQLFTFIHMLAVVAVSALDIDLKPGDSLADALNGADPLTTTLAVSGRVNADELPLLRDTLPRLTVLDLSQATLIPAAIPPYAFAGTPLEHFIAPKHPVAVGEGAFAGSDLCEFTASPTVTTTGDYAFRHCRRLAMIDFDTPVIGRHAFSGCTSLTTALFGTSLAEIGDNAFEDTALTGVDLSQCRELANIGQWAFAASPSLTSVSLPGNTMTVGRGAFAFCPQLTSIIGLQGVVSLPPLFAADSRNLAIDTEPLTALAAVLDHALHGVSSVSTLTLPANLTHLGRHAMEGMEALRLIDATALTSVPTLDDDVWAGIDKSRVCLRVADDMKRQFKQAEQWCEFNIDTPSSLDITSDTGSVGAPHISVEGTVVQACSDSGIIRELAVYMVDGCPVAIACGNQPCLTVTLDALQGTPLIVSATDSTGRRTTLQIIM